MLFHFVVDFLENFFEDGPHNAKLGNIIFTCRCYVDHHLFVKNLNAGKLGITKTFSNLFFKSFFLIRVIRKVNWDFQESHPHFQNHI